MKLDVGGYNPLLGESYGEMAADSRSMHKSQGFGVARSRAPIVEYFKLLAAADPQEAAPESRVDAGSSTGSTSRWKRFAGAPRSCAAASTRRSPSSIRPRRTRRSRRWSRSTPRSDALPDAGWRAEKQREVTI